MSSYQSLLEFNALWIVCVFVHIRGGQTINIGYQVSNFCFFAFVLIIFESWKLPSRIRRVYICMYNGSYSLALGV